jgi:flagellar basal-body rod modification protein FlgD
MIAQEINSTLGNAGVSSTNSTTTAKKDSPMGQEQFLQLLLTQLQHQDPLDPVSNADFTAQLAQLSSLDSFQQLNSQLAEMLVLQELNQGANLIGKQVVFQQADASELGRGIVESVNVKDGKVQLIVGANTIELNQIRGIEQPADTKK